MGTAYCKLQDVTIIEIWESQQSSVHRDPGAQRRHERRQEAILTDATVPGEKPR